jgi:hypothetical protein
MRTSIISFVFVFCCLVLRAQEMQHKTLHELGWDVINFKIPALTELDTGHVNYLITLNRKGEVEQLEIMSNSFAEKAEKLWQESISRSSFIRRNSAAGAVGYKGSFKIDREYCHDEPVGTKEQIDLFTPPPKN